jgi:hypothetical protein
MTYVNPSKELVEEIRAIRKDLDYIKAHMVDVDVDSTGQSKREVF